MRTCRISVLIIAFFLGAYVAAPVFGQVPDSYDGTPYDVIYNHLYYLQEDTYRPALSARSFSFSDSLEARGLAIKLKQVLDGQGLFVSLESLPRDSTFKDSLTNSSVYVLFPDRLPEVFVERRANSWGYGLSTVESIPRLHKKIYPLGADLLLNMSPRIGSKKFLGFYVWQYLGIFLILLLSGLMYVITSWIVRFFLIRLRAISSTVLKEKVTTLRAIHRLSAAWITLQVVFMMVPLLQFSVRTSEYLVMGLRILSSLVFVLLLFRIFDLILAKLEQVAMETESKMDEQLLPILKRAVQFLILAFWLIHILSIIGVNVTALVAGISIGGLAVALAAQDTLKNLFGSVTIFLDRPFQVGDWVSFGDGEGIIEEVGIRSTRIRSFKNSLIYVPNSKISDTTVDNFGLRVYRRYSAKIGVTYNTPPDKIELFVEGLRKLVAEHPDTRKDYFEIHLNDLNAYSIDILFYIFFQVPGWSEELKAKHEIIMGILRLADEIGVQFAFPSQSIYLEKE